MEKDKLNKHIDKILLALSENPGLELERLYETITGKDYAETYKDFIIIESILKTEGLASENKNAGLFYITPYGLNIVHSGGYVKYNENKEKENTLQQEKKLLEIDQLKWSQKTRRQTVWIAWIALVLSFISLLINIIDKF